MQKREGLLHPMFDEIEACSDAELLNIHRKAILANHNGRLNYRIDAITAEIQKRVATMQAELERINTDEFRDNEHAPSPRSAL